MIYSRLGCRNRTSFGAVSGIKAGEQLRLSCGEAVQQPRPEHSQTTRGILRSKMARVLATLLLPTLLLLTYADIITVYIYIALFIVFNMHYYCTLVIASCHKFS